MTRRGVIIGAALAAACLASPESPPGGAVIVVPHAATLEVGDTLRATAQVVGGGGSSAAVVWTSADPAVAAVSPAGVIVAEAPGSTWVYAFADGLRDSLAVQVVPVPPPPPPGSWPDEPPGFTTFNDQPWDGMLTDNWFYQRRSSSEDDDILADSTAPFSPPHVLRVHFTTDMAPNTEPSVHWVRLPSVHELFTGWWIRLSPNWTASPAGAGKMTFVFTTGFGDVYTNLYHKGGDPQHGWIPGPPYRIGVNTEWAPYGSQVWLPNATTTFVNPGEWHRIEVYFKWETKPDTSGNGVIRWWVDGVLNGDYTNVHYPAASFTEFQIAPTLQDPPPATQYMYFDHTYLSLP